MSHHAIETEKKQHAAAIEALTRDLNVCREDVADVYQAALAEIATTARVTDYLPIFASRRAKSALRGEGGEGKYAFVTKR